MFTNESGSEGVCVLKLLIAADDYTGALDTGVKLAQQGVSTAVVGIEAVNPALMKQAADVLVVSTETRHQSPRDAYDTVYRLVQLACEIWPETALYKKTDSALRGNVGSELAAMLDASGASSIAYIPALPNQGRTTVNGCQLDHGQPIHETVFAQDCYAPVTCANIPQIIAAQTEIQTVCVPVARMEEKAAGLSEKKTIWIYDSESVHDLRRVTRVLKTQGRQRLTAGCAGFAECLASLLDLPGDGPCKETIWTKRLCIICGSTNPITQRQLRAVHERGSPVVTLPANVILNPDYDADRLMQSLLEQLPACAGFAVTTVDMDVPEEKLTYARRLGLNREEVRRTISKRLGLLTDRLCEHDGS